MCSRKSEIHRLTDEFTRYFRRWLKSGNQLICPKSAQPFRMDFEEIAQSIKAPNLISSPRNVEHFEAHLPEELEQLASDLPLDVCCKGGYCETGSVTVEDVEISDSTDDSIEGCAIIEFTEYDPSHFTDGWRKARLDFVFEWKTAVLVVRCRDARL